MATNQVQARNNGPPRNGLFSIPASATKKPATTRADTMASRSSAPRPKMVIRRLPPGLTQAEFDDCMGADWQTHQGKVDWAVYKAGKISTDLAKPSKPSRAYLHLTNPKFVNELVEKVRSIEFSDAKASAKDSALLGPPVVEYDPFGRIPSNRPRKDLREGTIDQDQEFIDFLESLTNPLPKVTTIDHDGEGGAKTKEKVTITPLIQFLKDKKANKGKEQPTSSKASKHNRQDSKDGKSGSSVDKKVPPKATTASPADKRSAQAIKVENAARDAVKVLNKQASNTKQKPEPPAAHLPAFTKSVDTATSPLADKKRERGNASVAAKMLQRDLGLGGAGGRGGRGGRRTTPAAPARPESSKTGTPSPSSLPAKEPDTNVQASPIIDSPTASQNSTTTKGTPATDQTTATPAQPPTGPSVSRVPPKTPSQPRSTTATTSARTPNVSPTATQAFLKHANPSQGITESLLEAAFAPLGAVSKVEIDKKKGFAYVDFAEPEGLQNAVKASPVKVAQGQVVVLERKTGPTLQARNARGGGSMGPIGGGQQSVVGQRGGPPVGPRGGRGGARGRGAAGRGGFRGGFSGPNMNAAKSPQSAQTAPESAVASTAAADVSGPENTKGVAEEA